MTRGRLITVAALALSAAACGGNDRALEIRQWTDDLAFRITVSPMPPAAEEIATYKVVVQDKSTGQPIETGQGRVFASNEEGAKTYDGLAKGKEVGTYYARLRFPVSGTWAMGLQFRRDPSKALERTQDWQQTVLAPRPYGSDTTKH
jgi:hypothetical protein